MSTPTQRNPDDPPPPLSHCDEEINYGPWWAVGIVIPIATIFLVGDLLKFLWVHADRGVRNLIKAVK